MIAEAQRRGTVIAHLVAELEGAPNSCQAASRLPMSVDGGIDILRLAKENAAQE